MKYKYKIGDIVKCKELTEIEQQLVYPSGFTYKSYVNGRLPLILNNTWRITGIQRNYYECENFITKEKGYALYEEEIIGYNFKDKVKFVKELL